MSDYLLAARRGREPKAWKAARFFVQAITFGVVEVVAALHLDGNLAVCMWAIAIYNAFLVVAGVTGLVLVATEAWKEDAE